MGAPAGTTAVDGPDVSATCVRRAAAGAVGLAVLAGLLACTSADQGRDPVPRSWRYVALGDSVAAGSGSPTSYPKELARLLQTESFARLSLQNLARGGQRSDELLWSLRRSPPVRRKVASADVITITVGANDLVVLHPRFRAGTCGKALACYRREARAFLERWKAILDEIIALAPPGAAVRATNYYDPYVRNLPQQREDFGARYPEGTPAVVEALNRAICLAAEGRGVLCADLYHAFNGPDGRRIPLMRGLLAPDGFHPSVEGTGSSPASSTRLALARSPRPSEARSCWTLETQSRASGEPFGRGKAGLRTASSLATGP